MKKFLVENYYTCNFKTDHTLNELNDQELAKIDERKDGDVEVIEVKLNNRKTRKIGDKAKKDNKVQPIESGPLNPILDKVVTTNVNNKKNNELINKIKNETSSRFKMPDRRKGYIQKAQIGAHKVYQRRRVGEGNDE